jgi:cytochrome c5
MSETPQSNTAARPDGHEVHEGPIRTPKQLAWTVVAAFLVPIAIIVLLVNYVALGTRPNAGSGAMTPEAIAARLQPVGRVDLRDESAPRVIRTGAQVYQAQCAACHTNGLAGAPRSGDAQAWAARIATGYESMLTSVIRGKGAMGAQGGGEFSDHELGLAVVYMANNAGGNLPMPEAPAEGEPMVATAPESAAPTLPTTPAPPSAEATAPPGTPPAAAVVAAATPSLQQATPALYTQICAACHTAGVAGAPRSGDTAAWAPRIATGVDALTAAVIRGKGAMPPRGAAPRASDAELREVVEYMMQRNSP